MVANRKTGTRVTNEVDAEQRRRSGQADRPATTRRPTCIQVPVERDELAAEEKLIVAVPEGAGEMRHASACLVHRAGAGAARIAARAAAAAGRGLHRRIARTTLPACSTAPRTPTCSFCSSAPWHAGQRGDWPSRVRYSKRFPQPRHSYSKRGIGYSNAPWRRASADGGVEGR